MSHIPVRRTTALVSVAVALCAAAAAAFAAFAAFAVPGGARAAARAAAAAPAPAPAPACSPSQLVTYLRPAAGGGSAGAFTFLLNFSNVGSRACSLRGFPGVSAVDQAGHQLGKAAQRSGASVRTITLKPATSSTYGTAAAFLTFVDTNNFNAAGCASRIASGVKVFAPNTTVAQVVPIPFPACTTHAAVFLKATAVGPNPG
jgi:hypothetical protein